MILPVDKNTPDATLFASMEDTLGLAATAFAAVICAGVVIGFLYSASEGDPTIQIVALAFAGAIWLAGRACRYVLAGR